MLLHRGAAPEMLEERVEMYKKGQADCIEPVGKFRNDQVATFTMVHCNESNQKARKWPRSRSSGIRHMAGSS